MSVILPYQYKYISDKLGEMYAKIRDSIYKEGDATAAYNVAQQTLSQVSDAPEYSIGGIDAEPDYTTWGCAPADTTTESESSSDSEYSDWIENTTKYSAPPASIGNDLKTFWYTFANTNFNNENAKVLATAQVGNALRRLNKHVVNRMSSNVAANRTTADVGGPLSEGDSAIFTVSNITDYYNNYAFVSDADAAIVNMNASQLSLFDLGNQGGESPDGLDSSPTYFSADFVELSSRIGVTVPSGFITP